MMMMIIIIMMMMLRNNTCSIAKVKEVIHALEYRQRGTTSRAVTAYFSDMVMQIHREPDSESTIEKRLGISLRLKRLVMSLLINRTANFTSPET
jgi:hypothetical protein